MVIFQNAEYLFTSTREYLGPVFTRQEKWQCTVRMTYHSGDSRVFFLVSYQHLIHGSSVYCVGSEQQLPAQNSPMRNTSTPSRDPSRDLQLRGSWAQAYQERVRSTSDNPRVLHNSPQSLKEYCFQVTSDRMQCTTILRVRITNGTKACVKNLHILDNDNAIDYIGKNWTAYSIDYCVHCNRQKIPHCTQ